MAQIALNLTAKCALTILRVKSVRYQLNRSVLREVAKRSQLLPQTVLTRVSAKTLVLIRRALVVTAQQVTVMCVLSTRLVLRVKFAPRLIARKQAASPFPALPHPLVKTRIFALKLALTSHVAMAVPNLTVARVLTTQAVKRLGLALKRPAIEEAVRQFQHQLSQLVPIKTDVLSLAQVRP